MLWKRLLVLRVMSHPPRLLWDVRILVRWWWLLLLLLLLLLLWVGLVSARVAITSSIALGRAGISVCVGETVSVWRGVVVCRLEGRLLLSPIALLVSRHTLLRGGIGWPAGWKARPSTTAPLPGVGACRPSSPPGGSLRWRQVE